MKPPFTAAVKFCGGCNPYYDAREALCEIKSKTGLAFLSYDPEHPPDICLVIKQCRARCIGAGDFPGACRTFVIESAGEAGEAALKILEALNTLKEGMKP